MYSCNICKLQRITYKKITKEDLRQGPKPLTESLNNKMIKKIKEYMKERKIENSRAKRKTSKSYVLGYRANGVQVYLPKPKKYKVALLVGMLIGYAVFCFMCFVTIGTNWLIYFPKKLINKISAEWVYK